MKLADIPPGSELACRRAAKQIAEQVEFELETCRRLFGTEPEKVLELLANTPDWKVFLEEAYVATHYAEVRNPLSLDP